MDATDEQPFEESDELLEVRRRRYKEARQAGLSLVEAKMFSESDSDVGRLRSLATSGCPPALIARIVL